MPKTKKVKGKTTTTGKKSQRSGKKVATSPRGGKKLQASLANTDSFKRQTIGHNGQKIDLTARPVEQEFGATDYLG